MGHQFISQSFRNKSAIIAIADLSGTTTTGSTTSTIVDSASSWPTADGGLKGCWIAMTSGSSSGYMRRILSNTATSITVESVFPAAVADSGETYVIHPAVALDFDRFAHCFAALECFTDAYGETPEPAVTSGLKTLPSGGTATFYVATTTLRNNWQTITGGTVTLSTANNVVNWTGNTAAVRCVLASWSAGSSGITHVRLVVNSNAT